MTKPTYDELAQRVKELEETALTSMASEKALRESEKKFKTLFEQAGDYILLLEVTEDKELIIVDANKSACDFHGYPREEFIGMPLRDLDRDFDTEQKQSRMDKIMAGETIFFEVTHARKDGTQFEAEVSAKLLDSDDDRTRILSIERDITERKQIEKSLKKSRLLLAESQMVGKVGGWEFDIDTQKSTWTEETYRIHEVDYSYEPTVEEGINFYAPASRPIIKQAVERVINHGEPYDLDLQIITAKGNLRFVHTIGRPDMENRRVYGFFQDITERKLEEKKLEEFLNFNQLILNTSPIGILVFKESGPCVMANTAAEIIAGASAGQMLNLNYREMESYRSTGIFADMENSLRTGAVIIREVCTTNTWGKKVWFEGTISTFEKNGEKHILYLFNDIMKRKEAEAEREKLICELEKALAEIKTLRGLIPICSYCMKVRDDEGAWGRIEAYIVKHTDAKFSDGACPECFEREMKKIDEEL